MDSRDDLSVAVVAMSGRFPGARDLGEYWENLRNGVESIRALTESELAASRVDPELRRRPDYVRAGSFLDDIELFDAEFFGFSAQEARVMDPQHRLFMECAWEALEIGGYAGMADRPSIGVFASCSTSSYLLNNLYTEEQMVPSAPGLQMLVGNDKDYLATHVSYKLNLKGPSLCVQSACSSSLVGVHLAAQSLLNRECDAALAGGVTVKVPQNTGYLHQDGLILSSDARTYAFDERGRGTVFGSGVGVVLLRRLADAVSDGDTILAVIRGSAVNNDGSSKVGFTAPSVDGQANVIAEALTVAGVGPETISYVEAHGTGTPLGDPIEIAALTKAYRASTSRTGYCAIGSVKTNVGHLEAAAGIAGFIKAVLSLSREELPPSLNFERPNREIDFARTPFFVNRERRAWTRGDAPRRAGVSAFGFGGTNCHVVLEEAPVPAATPTATSPDGPFLLPISARTPLALRSLAARYRQALTELSGSVSLADVCYTAGRRRTAFEHRLAVTGGSFAEMARSLDRILAGETAEASAGAPGTIPSRGRCVPLPAHPFERKRYWVDPARSDRPRHAQLLDSHSLLQHTVEIADEPGIRYWESRFDDSRLSFLFDHIVAGEAVFPASGYIEAALAAGRKVFGDDCDGLVDISFRRLMPIARTTRLQLRLDALDGAFRIHARAEGSSWTLHASGTVARSQGREAGASRLSLDQIETRCHESIDGATFYGGLAQRGLAYGPAFRGIETIRRGDGEALARVRLPQSADSAPFHLHPALLDACFQTMAAAAATVRSEGPGRQTFVPASLRGLKVASASRVGEVRVHAALRSNTTESAEIECALTIADEDGGILATVDALQARAIDPGARRLAEANARLLYRLAWEPLPHAPETRPLEGTSWLIAGAGDAARALARRLGQAGAICESSPGASRLADLARRPWRGIVYLADSHGDPVADFERGCGDVLAILHSASGRGDAEPELWIVTRGAQETGGGGDVDAPGNAGLWGLGRVIRLESPERRCALVDFEREPRPEDGERLFEEIASTTREDQTAFRGGERLAARLVRAQEQAPRALSLRPDGSYLITGGLGSLGLRIAAWMASRGARSLVLAGRTAAETAETRALAEDGCRVLVRQVDVGDGREVRDLLDQVGSTMPPLRGIIHAAGVLDDGVLAEQTADRFANVMRPKVAGAWNLHRATEGAALDFFVLFSSTAAVLGSPGQGSYAAANAAMDAIAHTRRGLGLPATTINWGPWADVGMAASAGVAAHRRWRSRGIEPLPIERGLEVLGEAIADERSGQRVVLDVDWTSAFATLHGDRPPLLSRMASEVVAPFAPDSAFLRELAGSSGRARRRLLENRLRSDAAKLLGVSSDELDSRRPLNDLGLDSLMAIELRSALSRTLGRTLPATLLFDYPTIDALVAHLSAERPGEPAAARDSAAPASQADSDPVVGSERIAGLSEEEAQALLLRRLDAVGR